MAERFLEYWPEDEHDEARAEWSAYLSGQYVCLRTVGPAQIREKSRLARQLDKALAVLTTQPRDVVGRGLLGEAAHGLERLMLPQTAYDILRFGGGEGTWAKLVRAKREHLVTPAPTLPIRTDRLVLRTVTRHDAPALHEYYGREEVARYLPMGPLSLGESRLRAERLAQGTAPAADGEILRIGLELDGRLIGDAMLRLDGPALCMGEIGWTVHPEVSGRGLVTEAMHAVLTLAFDHYAMRRVFALLDARNERSRRLCERLGMRRELDAPGDEWSKGEWTPSYRYALLAQDWRAQSAGAPPTRP